MYSIFLTQENSLPSFKDEGEYVTYCKTHSDGVWKFTTACNTAKPYNTIFSRVWKAILANKLFDSCWVPDKGDALPTLRNRRPHILLYNIKEHHWVQSKNVFPNVFIFCVSDTNVDIIPIDLLLGLLPHAPETWTGIGGIPVVQGYLLLRDTCCS